ncbi:xanthine dehydrogenase family protein molybdopterin-binding subunit [Streptomyces boncukensis]|uniref:Xanthine dehydrogenase family protein molybdopterin-binding subunit n=1 Tax=Streptomyces boncukensis TaxID=2711219 RepID=A0A6G4X870_9ACTN|nr:xanthine dehydrogenase family protein molybdopterin-binding subunit [Streptomyces boncukensis]NGO72944.1 xanthine dehydrogenase family protein molybdopterin-binding subunit [Streptomyces boncukensis]
MARWEEPVGAALDRIEGPDKVTGRAVYSGDVRLPRMTHAVMVTSTESAARIRRIDTRAARAADGVVAVLTHRDRPEWKGEPPVPFAAEPRLPLQDDRVLHAGQCVALVVAESLEQARYGASRVRVEYAKRKPVPTLDAALPDAFVPKDSPYLVLGDPESLRGEPEEELRKAAVRITGRYRTATVSNAPMEPSSTLAEWKGGELTLYDSSQGVFRHRPAVAAVFGLEEKQVRMVSSLLGGGFGNKAFVWAHTLLAPLAARAVGRPVRLTIDRKQVFTGTGNMPETRQTLRLGADRRGRLRAITHESANTTSFVVDRHETTAHCMRAMYAVPHLRTTTKVARVNTGTATSMRTPGDNPGMFALESAMDELAYATGVDPVELRRRNYADADPESRKPWAGNRLLECYKLGAKVFGWDRREARPRSMRDGDDLVGWGMASAIRVEHALGARATVEIRRDGTAEVRTGTVEIGGGTLTTLAQVAASGIGVAPAKVRMRAGDTDLPAAAQTFGSRNSGSNGSAVHLAARDARRTAVRLAVADRASPLHGEDEKDIEAADGRLFVRDEPKRGETYEALLARQDRRSVVGEGEFTPDEDLPFARSTFGAHFTEVRIDRDLPRVRVTRHVGVFDCGLVLNAKTARNQAQGGIIYALGAALMERLVFDPVSGRMVNPALTDYHVPVHADIGSIDARFVGRAEPDVNPLGAKGLGEVCAVGVAPAVANAVYHATGRRVRELPLTPEKLLPDDGD